MRRKTGIEDRLGDSHAMHACMTWGTHQQGYMEVGRGTSGCDMSDHEQGNTLWVVLHCTLGHMPGGGPDVAEVKDPPA